MELIVTTTGSFPPLEEDKEPFDLSTQNAIQQQMASQVDLLVDGQARGDIVGIFARRIGLVGEGLPYQVIAKIGELEESVTLHDLEVAATASNALPLKAHITGPVVMAESCLVNDDSPKIYQGDEGYHQLTLDLAAALAQETRLIAEHSDRLNIQFLQIDEPSLVFGADLTLAHQAIGIVSDAWRKATGKEVILHVCGDVRSILPDLSKMPVEILNLENVYLREATDEIFGLFKQEKKKLALGLVPVNTDRVPTSQRVARELLAAVDRYGSEHVWGITPSCGLRLSSPDKAVARIQCLVEAADIVRGKNGRRRTV